MKDSLIARAANRLSNWFPVILLASLAMLTYWLDAQVHGDGRRPGAGAKEPDYFVEDFEATRYGKDGTVVEQLAAKRMTHFPDGQPTQLIAPHLTDTPPGKPPMRARADNGRITADNEHVYLSGNVVTERDAQGGRGKLTMATDALHVQPRVEKADTDRRVTITDATGTHVGNAMEVDNKARTLKLRNGVTGEIRPGTK